MKNKKKGKASGRAIVLPNTPPHGPEVAQVIAEGKKEDQRYDKQNRLMEELSLRLVASAKLTHLGVMLGGIAHEINNPLAVIHGNAGQLREMASEGVVAAHTLTSVSEKIERNVSKITNFLDSLRAFAREGNKDPIELIYVRKLADYIVDLCRARFKNRYVEFRVEEFNTELALECRAGQILHVLLSLLTNSHDAVANLEEKWVRLSITEHAGLINFSVIDSGMSIPQGTRDKLMTPFSSSKNGADEIGIGLRVSQEIVENHQGKLWFNTNCSNTCFVISIPRRQSSNTKKAA